jgi:hypothetical protein
MRREGDSDRGVEGGVAPAGLVVCGMDGTVSLDGGSEIHYSVV